MSGTFGKDVSSTGSMTAMGNVQFYEFGLFRLYPDERRLLRGGEVVSLKPIAFDILVLLIQKKAQLVTKQELMKKLWPDSFVEDSNLTVNLSFLRKALGDTRSNPVYIETLSGRGYRFIAPVKEVRIGPKHMLRSTFPPGYKANNGEAITSLAVMPFLNESGNPDIDYLCGGMTESIIASLSQLQLLRVMAYNTVFHYKGQQVNACVVGRKLRVGAVLTGSIRIEGEKSVLKLEMIDVSDGSLIWGERYEHSSSDIWIIQEQIVEQIPEKLRLKLMTQERKRLKRLTESIDAYHLYLRGCYFLNKRTEEGFRKAERDFVEALKIDRRFAHCYAGIARCYNFLLSYGVISPDEAMKKVRSAATKALEIDHLLSEPHTSIGHIKLFYEWDWEGAMAEFKLAIRLKPSSATAHHWYGILHNMMARFEEARKELQMALLIDPLSLVIKTAIGVNLYFSREYDQAISHLKSALDLDDFYMVHGMLGLVYAENQMFDEAIASLEKSVAPSNSAEALSLLGYSCARAGRKAEAEKILNRLIEMSRRQYVDPSCIALVPIGLGYTEQALVWLEKAIKDKGQYLLCLAVAPLFDGLRSNNRFKRLLQVMNLEHVSNLNPAGRTD